MHPEILAKEKIPSRLVTRNIWRERFEDISSFERYLAHHEGVLPSAVRELAIALGKPRLESRDLAFAHVRRAGNPAGVAAVTHLRLARDQVLEAEFTRDRVGEKAARRSGEHRQVARGPMLVDKLARRDGYHRHDLLLQVFTAPVFELRQRMGRQGGDVELGEFQHADFTAPVAVDDLAVGALEGSPIEHAALDQKLDPCLIAIAGEQRVVEIEKG